MYKRIVFIGLFPPVVTGQSIINGKILDYLRSRYPQVIKIQLSEALNPPTITRKIYKIFGTFKLLFSVFYTIGFRGKSIVYLNPARSFFGALRTLPMIWWSKIGNNKVVLHCHFGDFNQFLDSQPRWFSVIHEFTFKKVDAIIILGDSLINNFDFSDQVTPKLVPILNGITVPNSIKLTGKRIDNNTRINILYMSNLIESKGYLLLLHSMDILINSMKYQNIHCDFAGSYIDDPDYILFRSSKDAKQYVDNFVSDRNLGDFVTFHGSVSGKIKESLLKNAHISVLPTYYPTEGQPIVILEAMLNGHVTISTKFRAIPDMIKHNVTGLLLGEVSETSLASEIDLLIKNPKLFRDISQNSILHVSEHFRMEQFLEKIANLFESV